MQTGIIWGDAEPGCVIVTSGGKFKKKAGYQNGRSSDETYKYLGHGTEGNQDPYRYVNRLLIEGKRTVLLFLTREASAEERGAQEGSQAKHYKFDGFYKVGAWDFFTHSDGSRAGDRLLQFRLVRTWVPSHEIPAVSNFPNRMPRHTERQFVRQERVRLGVY